MKPVLRFAPSPTGRLHIGNVRTATLNWLFAMKHAAFILRLDDTDLERSTEAFAEGIRDDLDLARADVGKGRSPVGPKPRAMKRRRQAQGAGVLYPCYETRTNSTARRQRHSRRISRRCTIARPEPYDSERASSKRKAQAPLAVPPAQYVGRARTRPRRPCLLE